MDRIDLHMDVPAVQFRDLSSQQSGLSSAQILERVNMAREIQSKRFQRTKIHTNAQMNSRQIRQFCMVGPDKGIVLDQQLGGEFSGDFFALCPAAAQVIVARGLVPTCEVTQVDA